MGWATKLVAPPCRFLPTMRRMFNKTRFILSRVIGVGKTSKSFGIRSLGVENGKIQAEAHPGSPAGGQS